MHGKHLEPAKSARRDVARLYRAARKENPKIARLLFKRVKAAEKVYRVVFKRYADKLFGLE